jgi:hypothetical protein
VTVGFWTDWLDNNPGRGCESDVVEIKEKWGRTVAKKVPADDYYKRKSQAWWRPWDWE